METNYKVLIVDDDLAICETLQDILELRNYSCSIALSGAEALEMIAKASFDVVFCDLKLPDITGIELMEEMQDAGCAAVYFMITGDADARSAINALKKGAADYFIKPLNIDKLLHSVGVSLEMASTRESLLVSQQQLAVNYETLKVINSLLQLAISNSSLDDILQKSLDLMVNLAWVSSETKGAIFLTDEAKKNLLLKVHYGFSPKQLETCNLVPFGQCICGRAALKKEIQFGRCNGYCSGEISEEQDKHTYYSVPIIVNDLVEGIIHLNIDAKYDKQVLDLDFLTGVTSTLANIIQRQRVEQIREDLESQIQQNQRLEAMGTLAGGIAHDFNNILTAIIGFSDISLGMLDKESQPYEFVQQILASGQRASDLVRQILSFSRKGTIKKQPLVITPIIKEAIKLLRASLPANISVNLKFDPKLKSIMADPTQIHQILMNLCTNAFHALQENGGSINIFLQNVTTPSTEYPTMLTLPCGQYVVLLVEDDGAGIESTLLNHIFDPYFTTKEKGKGTGLGLSVVHGIVKGHGGDILVNSALGEGSKFTVFLPVLETISTAIHGSRADCSREMPRGTETILLVDDEEHIVFVTEHILKNLGYKVATRTSSMEALKAFEHDPYKYDLVISDIAMPKMTGDVLCAKLLAIRQDIPVILCTGFSELIDDEKSKKIGARKLLYKPIIKEELAKVVRDVFGAKENYGK